MNENRTQAMEWADNIIYRDNGVQRPILQNEEGRLFFPADPLDFDRDDEPTDKYYLDECEGWLPKFSTHLQDMM